MAKERKTDEQAEILKRILVRKGVRLGSSMASVGHEDALFGLCDMADIQGILDIPDAEDLDKLT